MESDRLNKAGPKGGKKGDKDGKGKDGGKGKSHSFGGRGRGYGKGGYGRVEAEDEEKEKEKAKAKEKEQEKPMQDRLKTKVMAKAKVESKAVAEAKDLHATTVERLDTLRQNVDVKVKVEKAKFAKFGAKSNGKTVTISKRMNQHQVQAEMRTPRQVRNEMRESNE